MYRHIIFFAALALLCSMIIAPAIAEEPPSTDAVKFPTVEEVEFESARAPDSFTAKVVGPRNLPMRSLLAVAFCRTEKEKSARGYDGWYTGNVQQIYGIKNEGPQIVVATVWLFRGTAPEGKTPVTKDWCAELATPPQPPN